MKKLVKDLNSKSIKELEKEVYTLRDDLAKTRVDMKVNMPKETNILFKKRKRLAVLLTVLNEKRSKPQTNAEGNAD